MKVVKVVKLVSYTDFSINHLLPNPPSGSFDSKLSDFFLDVQNNPKNRYFTAKKISPLLFNMVP